MLFSLQATPDLDCHPHSKRSSTSICPAACASRVSVVLRLSFPGQGPVHSTSSISPCLVSRIPCLAFGKVETAPREDPPISLALVVSRADSCLFVFFVDPTDSFLFLFQPAVSHFFSESTSAPPLFFSFPHVSCADGPLLSPLVFFSFSQPFSAARFFWPEKSLFQTTSSHLVERE